MRWLIDELAGNEHATLTTGQFHGILQWGLIVSTVLLETLRWLGS